MLQKHFVRCAICKVRYPARTVKTQFCKECKCMVCSNCNCEIYHLSYQLAQWDGVEAKEQKEASTKVARNKKKRQKKKQKKAKQRKQRKEKGNNNNLLYAEDLELPNSRSPSLSPAMKPPEESNQKGMNDISLSSSEREVTLNSGGGRSRKRGGARAMTGRQPEQQSHSNADGKATGDTGSDKNQTNSGDSFDTKKEGRGNDNTDQSISSPAPVLRASSADMEENNKLVSFFEQTGSILDLYKHLDENGEDDGMTPEELAELQREMAAMKK
jgi:hypothetical protein